MNIIVLDLRWHFKFGELQIISQTAKLNTPPIILHIWYCHINMHCRSLLFVPEYFSSQYPNNANPSIFSTVNKLHSMLCSCVCVCLCRTDGQSSEFANVFHPLHFHHTIIKVYNACAHLPTHMSMKPETLINSCHKHNWLFMANVLLHY